MVPDPITQPDVTVSLVNTSNRDLLRNCLNSVTAQAGAALNIEIYVVDNASTDGSGEMVCTEFPSVQLICNDHREGFGANHNKVLRVGKGRYFLVLNEDTVLLGSALEHMVRFADDQPEAGVVGPKIQNPDRTLQPSCARFPTLLGEVRSALFQRFSPYCFYDYPAPIHETAAAVDWLRGPCLLVRRSALEQIGSFDERYFIFREETDLCYRMHQANWKNVLCPAAVIIHYDKQTVRKGSSRSIAMAAQMHLSQYLYSDKHFSIGSRLLLRLFMLFYLAVRLARAYAPGAPRSTEERRWRQRLMRHLLWLTTRSSRSLIELGRVPGGVGSDVL